MMLSGLHTVADIFCCCCGQIVGWKYVFSVHIYKQIFHKEKSYLVDCRTIEMTWRWKSAIDISFLQALTDLKADFHYHVILVVCQPYNSLLKYHDSFLNDPGWMRGCQLLLTSDCVFGTQEAAHERTQKYKEGKFVLER